MKEKLTEEAQQGLTVAFIPSATREPVHTVDENDSLEAAMTTMELNDFSQLPVMRGKRKEPIGIISWQSIGQALSRNSSSTLKEATQHKYEKVELNADLYEAIHLINRDGFVVVMKPSKNSTPEISGIVTSADIGEALISMTKPYLLVRKCELHVRRLTSQLLSMSSKESQKTILEKSKVSNLDATELDDLNFGELNKVLNQESLWQFEPKRISKHVFLNHLNSIVSLRNKVMHFRILDDSELHVLDTIENFLELVTDIEGQISIHKKV